jgi:AmmeMemoRadiSam system protein B
MEMGSSASSAAESTTKYSRKRNMSTAKEERGYSRKAKHAGSWYESSPSALNATLSSYLTDAREASDDERGTRPDRDSPRAIISPHAGFSYSGPTAAYAYMALGEALSTSSIKSIVVLHPSHHVRLNGCAVSGASVIETPLGDLSVACDLREELLNSGHFSVMDQRVDEDEHSGEMQYPYIAKMLSEAALSIDAVSVLPIMVGGIGVDKEIFFGKVMSSFLARNDIFTIISSDFCHWGKRFGYFPPHDKDYKSFVQQENCKAETKDISNYIQELDNLGMDHIQMQNPGAFAEYLKMSHNTICGRHPIGKIFCKSS